jgi:hypothetical protein
MGEITETLPLHILFMVSGGLSIVLIICFIVLYRKLSKLRKAYVKMINGGSPQNVESLIIDLQEKIKALHEQQTKDRQTIQALADSMKKIKGYVGIHRYNAFGEGGNDLSFSMAIMDESQDGVVITGIHTREQMYVYAKPVTQGQSKYVLSPEEKEAIARSMRKE